MRYVQMYRTHEYTICAILANVKFVGDTRGWRYGPQWLCANDDIKRPLNRCVYVMVTDDDFTLFFVFYSLFFIEVC